MSCNGMAGKIIILSAPSGTGKSTIIKHLMAQRPDLDLHFSISATSRKPREGETDKKDYYFLTKEEFRKKIDNDEFVEWEEVYEGTYYGTLYSEVMEKVEKGHTVIMDIDVKGSINVKKCFGDKALALFIMPPSIQELEMRLTNRGTDDRDEIARRLAKAGYEMNFAPQFDDVVINDDFNKAVEDVADRIKNFKG